MAGIPKQFMLPKAVDAELERLLEAARHEGNPISRSDIVGALIWEERRTDGDALGVIVRGFLRDMQQASEPKVPAPGRPGPRPFISKD
ncbi:MAG: hypothetical protein ACYDGN_14400 [Acidimicrobiales bacterium]